MKTAEDLHITHCVRLNIAPQNIQLWTYFKHILCKNIPPASIAGPGVKKDGFPIGCITGELDANGD